jgi:hypothetical protein
MSPKASPLLGYNNNVRHKGHVFHIQTEDSGVRYGHIITHLFVDGGRILKSVKTSYSEHVTSERRTEIVREMMKQQHKAMFIALREGKFDAVVDGAAQPEPASVARSKASDVASPAAPAAAAASPRAEGRASTRSASGTPLSMAPVAPLRPAALRSAAPPELGRDRTPSASQAVAAAAAAPAIPRHATARLAKSSPAASDDAAARHAPTRPASTFGQARPQQGKTIFGEDPLSDKSLDEVILSYLSAELDEKK